MNAELCKEILIHVSLPFRAENGRDCNRMPPKNAARDGGDGHKY